MVADRRPPGAGISEARAQVVGPYRLEGRAGLLDRTSAPHTVANAPRSERIEAIAALRRVRMTGAEIAECLGMPLSMVGDPHRIGMGRLGRLGMEPTVRYEANGQAS